MLNNENIVFFDKLYTAFYTALYNNLIDENNINITAVENLLKIESVKNDVKFYSGFIQDVLMSDRELKAFYIAYKNLL